MTTRDQITGAIPCGPDLSAVIDGVAAAVAAGIDHVYFHQIGDPLDGFIDVWSSELRPALAEIAAGRPVRP